MLYAHLRGRLRQLKFTQTDLAQVLGLQQSAVSKRFNGCTQWTSKEMYHVLDLCRAQPEELHLYFPRDGKAASDSPSKSDSLGKISREIIVPFEIRIVMNQKEAAVTAYRIRIDRV